MLHQFILYFYIDDCRFGKADISKNFIFQCFYNGNIKNFRKELHKSIDETYNILKYKHNKDIFLSRINSTDLNNPKDKWDSDKHYNEFNKVNNKPYMIDKSKHKFTRGLNCFIETLIRYYDEDTLNYNELESTFIDVIKDKIETKSFKMVHKNRSYYKEGYLSVVGNNFLIM